MEQATLNWSTTARWSRWTGWFRGKPSALVEPFYPKPGRGRRPYPLRTMLRVHCVQLWYDLSGISPAVAAELAALPESFHRDPADRILVATARVLGATLVTQDQRVVDSGLAATLS